MNILSPTSKCLILFSVIFSFTLLEAAPIDIANWKMFNGSATNSGMTTNSPVIGDGSFNNADDVHLGGRFGTVAVPESVTLAVGETLTVSGSTVLTGGSGNRPDNFRVGVFNDDGDFDAGNTTWDAGGFLYATDNDIFSSRTNGSFVSTSGNATALNASTTDTGGTFTEDSLLAYDWSFSITRDSATIVDLSTSVTGGDNNVNFTATVEDQTTSLLPTQQ